LTDEERESKKRAEERRSVVNFVWYRVLVDLEEKADDELCGIARSCDVSASGVGIFTPRPLPSGELIFLEIATRKGSLSGVGTIVYSRQVERGLHRAGIRLEIVPPNDRPLWARILKSEP
jgi:hypothetical protein